MKPAVYVLLHMVIPGQALYSHGNALTEPVLQILMVLQ